MTGYSGTPLLKKLGWKSGQTALLIGVPDSLPELSGFDGFTQVDRLDASHETIPAGPYDVIHIFEVHQTSLEIALPILRSRLKQTGMIWVSWPKKASKVPTSVTEDIIRSIALSNSLVDIKVCAVDAVWSGLKLVIPVSLRH